MLKAPGLESMGSDDEHAFREYLPYADEEPFEAAMGLLRAGKQRKSKRRLQAFLVRHPLHIDTYHHLGNIAWDAEHLTQALKYHEMAYTIGRLTVPAGFSGKLPWATCKTVPSCGPATAERWP